MTPRSNHLYSPGCGRGAAAARHSTVPKVANQRHLRLGTAWKHPPCTTGLPVDLPSPPLDYLGVREGGCLSDPTFPLLLTVQSVARGGCMGIEGDPFPSLSFPPRLLGAHMGTVGKVRRRHRAIIGW